MKMTVRYQFVYILCMQLAASGVAFVFGMVAFWYFLTMSVAKEILSVVFIAVNFAMLYIPAKKFAILDYKPYTPLKPSKIKGALFGVAVSIITLIIMGIFTFAWSKYGTDVGIMGIWQTTVNVIFYFWSFPYNGIMGLSNGMFMVYSAVVMVVVPILATTSGYIAGSKKIELVEKFEDFMYEKK